MPIRVRRGILHLDFRFKGKRFRITTELAATPQNRRLAERWISEIHFQISLGTFRLQNHFPNYRYNDPVKKLGTFTESATQWLESHRESWAEWTHKKFKADLERRTIPKIGSRRINEITPKDLRLVRESILAEGKLEGGKLKNRSVNRIMQPVKAIFNELHADGDIESNPAARLGRLKQKRIAEIQPFAAAEVKRILKAIDSRYVPFVQFLFESGFRLNEAFGIRWQNVNLVTGVLSVRRGHVLGKDKDPKTERATRDVEITSGMMKALKEQKRLSFLAGEYVFVSETGKALRHTFATSMIETNKNPLWIANQMGTSLEMLFSTYAVYFQKRGWSQKWSQAAVEGGE